MLHFSVTDNNNPIPSPVLQEARLRVLPYRVCREAYQNRQIGSRLSEELQICAGKISGVVDSCFVSIENFCTSFIIYGQRWARSPTFEDQITQTL